MESHVHLSMLEIPAAACIKAVHPVPLLLVRSLHESLQSYQPNLPTSTHTNTFSSSHTKPVTLNFQPVNLPARFPNRWQVSRMRKTSISSLILQNTRTLEEACLWPHNEIRAAMSSQMLRPPELATRGAQGFRQTGGYGLKSLVATGHERWIFRLIFSPGFHTPALDHKHAA